MANTSRTLRLWDIEHAQEIIGLGFVSRAYGIAMPEDQRWFAIVKRLEVDRWLTDAQRAEGIELIHKLQRFMVGAGDSLSSDTAESG